MNNIDMLIAELCPKGVEFRELEEVCSSISAGGDLPENYLKGQKFPTVELPYPIYSNGTENNALYGFTDSYRIDSEAVTISARGTIGYHTVRTSKFTPIVRLITLIPKKDTISIKFLNYALDITPIGGTSGSIPQLTVPTVKKISIPLPPLPIQQEIVNILDKFTELQAALQAELQARSAQYEYYRNELLNFEGKQVGWSTLGEVSRILRGTAITEKETISGEFPVFANSPNPIYFHGKSNRSGETIVIARSGAYSGLVSYWNKPFFLTDAFSIHPDNTLFKTKFVYFFLKKEQEKIHQMKKGSGVPHVRAKDFEYYSVPIPSLPEQERIVGILDKFDALLNDISVGLPAEIEARRKQYEFYRGKLMDFKSISNG